MSEIEKSSDNQPKVSKSRKIVTFVFIVVAIVLSVALVSLYNKNELLKAEHERQEQEISNTYLKLDSVSNELDLRIQTILELGGEVDTLRALKEQLENDKRALLRRDKNQKEEIAKLNSRVDGYREIILIKDEEIKELKMLAEQLAEENTTLKVEKNKLNQSIQELEQNKLELVQKVEKASKLEIANLKVNAINSNGKERDEQEYKNRHIERLKIQFTVLENEIAPIEGKELLLRVVAPDGNVLFDVAKGSGSFTFENREMFYTAKQEILYDRKNQLVTFFYNKGGEYAIGKHKVEVYTDNYLMGEGSFVVR